MGNFAIGPALCIKLCLMYGQTGNFQYFSFCLAHWLLKPFWEISPLALLHASSYVSCMAKQEISNISLSVWHIGCQSHGILGNFTVFPPKSAISQTCQNKLNNLIPPSYGLHLGKYKMGIIGVKYTIFIQNAM